MKHSITILVCLLHSVFVQFANAQDRHVWQDEERISLQVSNDRFVLQVSDSVYHEVSDLPGLQLLSERNRYRSYNKKVIWVTETTLNQMDVLRDQAGVPVYISPVYELENEGLKHTTGELLVRWKQGLTSEHIEELENWYQLRRMEERQTDHLEATILYEYMPPYETTSLEVANALYESGFVQWANPNYTYVVKQLSFNGGPDDPLYSQQWNLPQIQANHAWDITTGGEAVVAVFDDGVDLTHDDLENNLFRDGQGNVIGHNATDRGAANDPHPDAEDAHGTAVAGIMGAVTDNNEGVAGIVAHGSVMPLQMSYTHPIFGSPFIETQPNWWTQSLNFAVNNGANVVNMSVGFGNDDTDFNNAMANAVDNGVVLVAASGNDGSSNIAYPANNANVIAVGATLQDDTRWTNSQYGSNLDLVAPGGAPIIWTTDRPGNIGYTNDDYVEFRGTSAAAPHVAAVAALMLTVNPALSPGDIRNILQSTADWLGHMGGSPPSNEYGHGRLNAYEAVKDAMPNQYAGHHFSSSVTLPDLSRIQGTTSLSSGVVLTVGSGNVTVIEGSMNSSGSTLAVNGRLIIDESATISGVEIEVSSSGELIIREGASLSFGSGQGIVAYGPVNINGTGNNQVTLQASGSGWNGVEIHSNNSSLRYVDIENATNGVGTFNVSGLVIQDVEVSNSTWDGFRFINTSTASPAGGFGRLRAEANGVYGVYYDGGSNNGLTTNIMKSNPSAGLFITGGASLEGVVNSRIYDGNTNGLRADNASYLQITSSSIHDNAYRDAFAFNNASINARGNWWGSASPSTGQFEEVSGGSIDYSNHLPIDPLPGGFQKRTVAVNEQILAGKTQPAIAREIAQLRRTLSGLKYADALGELQHVSDHLSPELRQWANILSIELHQRLGQHSQAITAGSRALSEDYLTSVVQLTLGRRLFYSYLLGVGDEEAAKAMLNHLEVWGEETSELQQLEWLLQRYANTMGTDLVAEIAEEVTTESDIILSNYPNPFNPSTIIRYQLPENGPVTLQVFDLLGRQVAELVNEVQSAGMHSIHFNAEHLSSGFYIYRLQAGDQVLTRQMSLVK